MVGNANLRPEIADNFSLGLKGKMEQIQYQIAGYYNRYKQFIDWVSSSKGGFNPFIQYQNQQKAKIYGVTMEAKWQFYGDFFVSGGVIYSKGHTINDGKKAPINTIQPLKLKAGAGYDTERFGINVYLTHLQRKADKDINGTIYNPTKTVNLVDLGIHWKPTKNLTLLANVNNLFDRKYWHWKDISYFAIQSSSASPDRTASLTAQNADTYTAPGRHWNMEIRYSF